MHTRALRVLRGSAAALFATIAAAFSHQLAGGIAPSVFGIAVSLIISIAVCTLLAGRTVSFVRLTVATVASQTMYHALFSSMLTPAGIAQHNMSAPTFSFTSAAQTANSAMRYRGPPVAISAA
ncbi:Cytochrome c-type biogenesis protein DsbD, protein-disulfide reductase [Leifsonia rubra CMS 76R]|nr:Cytochrome c-type biogenesis protein DsbD, protein-disulfide reductase [Leifsonia rubra CMS 76R]